MLQKIICDPRSLPLSQQQFYPKEAMIQSKFISAPTNTPPFNSPARHLQQRFKKEITLKFTKQPREDEANRSSQSSQRRNRSLLLSNPLTKSSFSLTDATTHKATVKDFRQPMKDAAKPMSSKKTVLLLTRQLLQNRRRSESTFCTPSNNPVNSQQSPAKKKRFTGGYRISLLFRDKNIQYKSASQRKIARIDSKIATLQQKSIYLESLLPVPNPKPQPFRPQPKRYPISEQQFRQKIINMVNQLIRTVQLYFNMYLHDNIVGGHFKKVEGYSRKISSIIMLDDIRARRFSRPNQLTALFQVFANAKNRTESFMEEDMGLFNALSNFLLKLEMKYGEILEGYKYYEHKRRKDEKEAFRKTKEKFEKRMGKNEQINNINNFIQNRLYLDQTRREDYMQNLQKRGVVLNLIERSRELILRQKENAAKQVLQST